MAVYVLLIILTLQWYGKHHLVSQSPDFKSRNVAIAVFCLWIVYNIYYFIPAHFRWDTSLPLHVCDLLGAVAPIALISNFRWARAFLYFCGIALASQAVITPVGNQDPSTLRFWLYWTLHAAILAASVYDIYVRRYRPQFADFALIVVMDIVYAVVIIPMDIVTGWNYGYLGNHRPEVHTAVDFFGTWPARIGPMIAVVIVAQALFYLPWALIRRNVSRRAAKP